MQCCDEQVLGASPVKPRYQKARHQQVQTDDNLSESETQSEEKLQVESSETPDEFQETKDVGLCNHCQSDQVVPSVPRKEQELIQQFRELIPKVLEPLMEMEVLGQGQVQPTKKATEDSKRIEFFQQSLVRSPDLTLNFDSIVGHDEQKETLMRIMMNSKKKQKKRSTERMVRQGVLLYGLPGTGKTSLVKAVAKEADHNIVEISARTARGRTHEATLRNLRAAFKVAEQNGPCILLMEDAHKILRKQTDQVSLVPELLRLMKIRFNDVMVMAVSSEPHLIDTRFKYVFESMIFLDSPTRDERHFKLSTLLHQAPRVTERAIEILSDYTEDFTCAQLEDLVKLATELATLSKDEEENQSNPCTTPKDSDLFIAVTTNAIPDYDNSGLMQFVNKSLRGTKKISQRSKMVQTNMEEKVDGKEKMRVRRWFCCF